MFRIDADSLHWIDKREDNCDDLCLHGHAAAYIGDRKLEYHATVSATALFLLKTLTEDHIIYEDNQMLPCCGFFLIADERLENCDISGCPNGIDWSVLHDGEQIRLILADGFEITVPLNAYREEVFRFADKIEAFYLASPPRKLPEDEFERNGYTAFWNEWRRRRG
ncbi:MAG: hypothetical protein NC399_05895 [Muribaculum sp.]|nr:hypothetical protein [Muribaculum sp.]